MKITHDKVGQNLNTTGTAKSNTAAKSDSSSSTDAASLLDTKSNSNSNKATQVELSQRAQDMKKIKETAMAAPDVDAAKVAHFQSLIDNGKYKVDSEAVADKMVDEHLAFS